MPGLSARPSTTATFATTTTSPSQRPSSSAHASGTVGAQGPAGWQGSPTVRPSSVTVSIRRMSLGTGYEYLLSSVVRGDGAVPSSSPLIRYYAESGTPPGRFLGAGLAGLNTGAGVPEGSQVTERMLFNLLGMLADPITGEPLGNHPPHWSASQPERIRLRVAQLRADLPSAERANAVAAIQAEEAERERQIRRPVAGFDLTFSVPKSVSTVWGLADATTQAWIYEAHQEAIRIAIAYAEQHIFFSRSGRGGAMQEDVRGVIGAAFDHWDSRSGDPHLHTHVVIANRAQTLDGAWRTLDSKTLHKYVVALSELHEGVLQDLLTARLGYGWDERARRHSAVPRHDIAGVPDGLINEFSRRSADIETATAALIAEFARTHGRRPGSREVLRLRQQATLQTRPDKQQHTLAEQAATWRARARPFVGGDTAGWADGLRGRSVLPALGEDVDGALLHHAARLALTTVATRRATFTHANVLAEAHRQLHGARFASPLDRLAVADRMTLMVLDEALLLTPPAMDTIAAELRRPDGSSKLQHRGAQIYTTHEVMDAESRLLDAARCTAAPGVAGSAVAGVTASVLPGRSHRLGPDQAAAVAAIATSGRVLDVLVGPAGTGKTASLAGLRQVWEEAYGTGSVVGLAPSAAAAEVLADELGIDTENTAKWLHEAARQDQRLERMAGLLEQINALTSAPSTQLGRHLRAHLAQIHAEYERWMIRPDQLVLVDEAGLAGTLALDRIVSEARGAGAKVLLVGDWAQLSAMEAGGAFAMLVNDRHDAPELTTVRRFENEWERDASIRLRLGDHAAIDAYTAHERIRSGDRDEMLDALYSAWRDDTNLGLTSLMIAGDSQSVAQLNLRARADRVAAGHVQQDWVDIAGGAVAGVGDHVITRQNDRRLATGRRWVKNGDTWTVESIGKDGSLWVRGVDREGQAVLPVDYVRRHVELGYAATTFRAQGRTVDTAHALVGDTSTRESLYVSATRGRLSNTVYIDQCTDPDPETSHGTGTTTPVDVVLRSVLDRSSTTASAHGLLGREYWQPDDQHLEFAVTPQLAPDTHHQAIRTAAVQQRSSPGLPV